MKEIITIMMVTYNRLPLTKRTIESLRKTVHTKVNFVIIDNCSTDDTQDYLIELQDLELNNQRSMFKIRLLLNTENLGIARARNQALQIADELNTEWYATLDNDVEMCDGWLEECIDILKANKSYGGIGVNMEGTSYPLVAKNHKIFQDKPAGNLGTACMVFPKSIHKMIGFFNTEYSKYYGLEDSDFGMRIRAAGFKLGYLKELGLHFGVGDNDKGEYRTFKTKEHDSFVKQFQNNCSLYFQNKKPIYVAFKA